MEKILNNLYDFVDKEDISLVYVDNLEEKYNLSGLYHNSDENLKNIDNEFKKMLIESIDQ